MLVLSVGAVIGQSQYSGIYTGSDSHNGKFKLALTKGGRCLGLSSFSEGFADAIDPAISTIDAKGKLKGATPAKAIINATVSADGKITGTIKEGKITVRITGKRVFN